MASALRRERSSPILRRAIEAALIVFMLYAALIMRDFTKSSGVNGESFIFAIEDVFTFANFVIAVVSALVGSTIIEYLRNKQ